MSWYPSAKAEPENGTSQQSKSGRPAKSKSSKNGNIVTNKEIRDVILGRQGDFKVSDIEAEIATRFPSKQPPGVKISSVLFILKKKKGLVKEVSPRNGSTQAVYVKA